MAQVDTSMYNALGVRPKSIGEYSAEMDSADLRRQGMQQNALALRMDQQKLGEYERGIQDQNALRQVVSGFGADPKQNVMKLFGAGRLTEAQAYQKSIDESAKARGDVVKTEADARKTQLSNGLQKFEIVGQVMSGVRDQASYDLARQQLAQTFGPEIAQNMPPNYDPNVIEQNRIKAMSVKDQMAQQLKELTESRQSANETMIPDSKGGWKVNEPLVGAKTRVAQAGASNVTMGTPVAVQTPDGKTVMVQPGNRPGVAPQVMMAPGTNEPLRPAKDPNAGPKISAEVERQIGGVSAFDKDLAALEAALKDFDPRGIDQFNTTKRAKIQSIAKQAQLSAKEAAALGALSGPDMALLEGILNDPTSTKGAVSGSAGLAAQIKEARAGNARRVLTLQERYGDKATAGINVSGATPSQAASSHPPEIGDLLKKYSKPAGN